MQFISLIYDVLAVLIVILAINRGAKNGFAKTAIQTVGYICSAVAAIVIAQICASLIYTTLIEPGIVSGIETSLNGAADTESVVMGLSKALEELPAISGLLFNFEGVAENLVATIGFNPSEIASSVAKTVIQPVVQPILETLIFAVSFILLISAVSFIAKGSKLVNEVPIIGGANSFFGGVAGIINGAIELFVAAVILRFVISAGLFPEYFSEAIIEKTFLFKWIYFGFPYMTEVFNG